MSAAVNSANKGNLYSEESEALYDPYGGLTIPSFYTEIQWPEWNDADLNAESWDEGKGRATTAGGSKKDSLVSQSSFFNDFEPNCLPPLVSENVFSWKRPQEVFENAVLTVYDPANSEFELTVPSPAADCDFFKSFNEEVPILQYYALRYGFPVELETPKFTANTQGEPWRPWHHIYSMCKAGKGQVHKPLHCPFGKYVARVFYMGAWRRIVVDDKIPCDKDGNCMLPVTQSPGELWPIILSKVLLKITWKTPADDLIATDFPMLSFFTGWVQGRFTTINKTAEQIWRRLGALVPSYELPKDPAEPEEKSGAPSKRESKRESRPSLEKKESHTEKFCFLLAILNGFPEEENLLNEYAVGVTMVRDCPLERVNKRERTKPWKRIRWVHWAKDKGLWTDEETMPPYRRVQNIVFVKELVDFLAPDPKQEAVLYEVRTEDELSEDELLSYEENFQPEQWCDFLKLKNHLRRMYVYFKPSFFTCNFKVTSLKEKQVEAPPSGKSTAKVPPPQNLFSYPPILKPTSNEPLFLFCESSTGMFLCISLWVSPKQDKNFFGYLDGSHPELLKIGHGSLIVEQFQWKTFEQGKIIGVVKTVGNATIGLNLKPGRHLLKLWLNTDSPYVIDVYSNVNTIIHKNSSVRLLMTRESEMISNYVADVSNAFIALTLKFGKPELPLALHDFYNAILPGNDGIINYRRQIDDFIETFLNCLLLSLKDAIPSTDELKIMMWALQSLFFNPNLRCDLPPGEPPSSIYGGTKKAPPKKVMSVTKERTLSEIVDYPWTFEEIHKIVLIQRVFRGFRVRLLWKYQSPARKEFKPYVERLKKICDTLFVPPRREQEVGMLLRRVVMAKPDLLTTFKFHEDFSNVVQLEEYSGKLSNVEPFAWIPILRFVIGCHSKDPVPCAFHFSCNLENFVIQGFDNDTNQEIFRLTKNVSPHYYRSNVRGYTIFAFGWNEANPKTVNWKLELMRMKYFPEVHLCNMLLNLTCHPYTMPSLDILELRNFYTPNSKSRICRCFIKVQKRTLLTLRFSASYSEVLFVVTISLEKSFSAFGSNTSATNKIISKIHSTNGAVMVPSLVLEFVEGPWSGESCLDSEPTVYVVEVFVLNNTWPLTKQEWGTVEPLRVNGESWKDSTTSLQSKKGGADSRRKLTRMSRRTVGEQKTVENPFWLMQVVNDSGGSEGGEVISIEEDKSHIESVRAMKMSWEERDPGRRKRGKEMRLKFLHMIVTEEKSGMEEGEGDFGEFDKEVDKGSEIQLLLERMTSFSYLTNDTSPTRYTFSPRTLPPVPLFQLLCKYAKVKKAVTDVSEGSEFFGDLSDNTTKSSKKLYEETEEEMKDFLSQCVHFRSVIANHMTEEQKLSSELMEQAYESRLKAIERMMR